MDHYVGPAKIIQQLGTRSFLVEYKNAEGKMQTFERDAGMLSLIPPSITRFDPELQDIQLRIPHKHRSLYATPLREGEVVILKDGSKADDWYCAQIIRVLPTHVIVHYYTTITPSMENYTIV